MTHKHFFHRTYFSGGETGTCSGIVSPASAKKSGIWEEIGPPERGVSTRECQPATLGKRGGAVKTARGFVTLVTSVEASRHAVELLLRPLLISDRPSQLGPEPEP